MGCFPCNNEQNKQKLNKKNDEESLNTNIYINNKNLETKQDLIAGKTCKEKKTDIKSSNKIKNNNKSKEEEKVKKNAEISNKINNNFLNTKEPFLANEIESGNIHQIKEYVSNPFNKPKNQDFNKNESNKNFKNEGKNYVSENNNNKDDNNNQADKINNDNNEIINKDKNNFITNNENILNDYDNFKDNKEYYLKCQKCKKYILNIEEIAYKPDKKDFIITYKCFCNEKNQNYFYQVISANFSYCGEHKNKLNFLCEKCNKLLCERCLEEHKNHIIKTIINKDVFSEEIISKINEKRNEFKGINIITKIINFYQSYKDNEIIANHNNYIKLIEKSALNEEKVKIEKNKNNLLENENININNNVINNGLNNAKKNNMEAKNILAKDLSIIKYENTKTIMGHNDIISVLINLSNGYIASGSYDETVKIWDITKEEKYSLIMKKNATGAVLCLLEFEPGKLLGGTNDNMINLWDLKDKENEEFIFNFCEHLLFVNALVKCDENHFASASNDSRIIIWNYKNKIYENILNGHTECIISMILLKSGYLCSASTDEDIRIWDWKQLKCLFCFKPHNKYTKCLIELNNEYLLTASEDNTIGLWQKNDFENYKYKNINYIKGHECPVRTLCKINDNYFVSGSFDNKIKIWDLRKNECVQTLEGHQSYVICVIKFKEDSLISCSSDKNIKIWKKKLN